MKKNLLVLVLLGLFMIGCMSVEKRTPNNVTKLSEKNDIDVIILETVGVSGNFIGAKSGDVGLKLKVKNNSKEVKYLVWSSSSLGYDGLVSRIVTGNDKVANINSIVPNTAIMAGRETIVTIYSADFIQYEPKTQYGGGYYFTESPMKSNVELILSYSGSDTSKLEQAQYIIDLPSKE